MVIHHRACKNKLVSTSFFLHFKVLVTGATTTAIKDTTENDCANSEVVLSCDEEGALSYVAGYVIRAVSKKVKASAIKEKEELLGALNMLYEHTDDTEGDTDTEDDTEPDWMKLCNRGGLYIARIEFRNFLESAEIVVKRMTRNIESMVKDKIILEIKKDDDVIFWWKSVCKDVCACGTSTQPDLQDMIVEHYVTIRGFAATARWLEKYKIDKKQNFQKSKGLRKKLGN